MLAANTEELVVFNMATGKLILSRESTFLTQNCVEIRLIPDPSEVVKA